jgi:hypothetical protein
MANGEPSKPLPHCLLGVLLLIRRSSDEPLRLCSQQSSTYFLYCRLWCFRSWPHLAVLVSLELLFMLQLQLTNLRFQPL